MELDGDEYEVFLSTLSLRRATADNNAASQCRPHFYPRSPCGERPLEPQLQKIAEEISIHALLAESDFSIDWYATGGIIFLSTLSLRRATAGKPVQLPGRRIFLSTLSLRRATGLVGAGLPDRQHFYPRSPCGERPPVVTAWRICCDFYPRSPCGERPSM